MSELVRDKVVIVTGGAGLLGRTFCQAIADNGGIAVVAEYDIAIAERLCTSLENASIVPAQVNITEKNSIKALITTISQKYGKIDALVNSAYPRNKNYGKHFFEVTYNDFCENLGMNLGGYFLTSQQFATYFEKQGYGNIINLASIYGVIAPRFEIYDNTPMTMPVEYAAIKSGLIHLTKYMAKYFKGKNIRVNTISLGGIEDKQPETFLKAYKEFCLNKGMLNAKDISGTLLYLLSDLSEFVNGQNIVVDDGFTL
ncbi:oxidoreductase [Capnocytophaga sp. oral taxon 324]|uniref:oxidoreductase n=1 Tax=Capnocytophaga sp. oral taxon 324 TaxID=712211 RepID=UPI0002A2794C|nr:oxidoreductase [Capnocytophaga sp. oral taxon 324]EKY13147.1 oxidoreductase, short chain dehydrogenase/reductase family protein [Capnocytophaga sp. oral taxon 324 str. F0483]